MRVAIVALNTKYIHTSLAAACLASACQLYEWEVVVREYTINQHFDDILADLYSLKADIISFSCYIWNIQLVIHLIQDYKKIDSRCRVILGGPEVSYDAIRLLEKHPEIDFVVRGEGEEVFPKLLDRLHKNKSANDIDGITYRKYGIIIENPEMKTASELDCLPRPAYDSLYHLHNRVIYYEASRGCPFQCSYCLSSIQSSVRWHSMARIKEDLLYLHRKGVREIKFVDRTFNASEARAMEIMRFLLTQPGNIRYHFEIRAELMSDTFISFLTTVPARKFFFEIGIQSTNPETLDAIGRKSDWQEARKRIIRLGKETNVHLHLDLIAGLPYENYERFQISLNDVLQLKPHVIQLGFLKFLKGSPMSLDREEYGYSAQDHPPYEILQASHISYEELVLLHRVEDLLERYYNSGAFHYTVEYAGEQIYQGNYFKFFEELAWFWIKKGYFGKAHKREAEYAHLAHFFESTHFDQKAMVHEFIKLDYLMVQGPHRMPANICRRKREDVNERLYVLLKDDQFVDKYLPHLRGLNPGDRRRRVHLEYMNVDPENSKQCRDLPVIFVYPPGSQKASHTISLYDCID